MVWRSRASALKLKSVAFITLRARRLIFRMRVCSSMKESDRWDNAIDQPPCFQRFTDDWHVPLSDQFGRNAFSIAAGPLTGAQGVFCPGDEKRRPVISVTLTKFGSKRRNVPKVKRVSSVQPGLLNSKVCAAGVFMLSPSSSLGHQGMICTFENLAWMFCGANTY
jgi:hypothetical protein